MKKQNYFPTQFAVCIDNTGAESNLALGKLYEVIPHDEAVMQGWLNVIVADGQDYWHEAERFYLIDVPSELAAKLHDIYRAA
jgi:hypothetical protein